MSRNTIDHPDPLSGLRQLEVPGTHRQRRRRHWLRYLLVVPGLIVAFLAWSLVGAATAPGNESFSAKWADWLRSHHAASVVNQAEAFYYRHHQPPKGGQPAHLNPLPGTGPVAAPVTAPAGPTMAAPAADSGTTARAAPTTATTRPAPPPPHLPAPPAVGLVVAPALPGEGQWQPVGPTVAGIPGMYESQFRADAIYTREITSAVWIDPLLLRVGVVPGSVEPGGSWPVPPYIPGPDFGRAVAAFNGGFRFADARGGFYLDGQTGRPLRPGAASLVIYRNGRVDIGTWGSEVTMSPQVTAVVQNLVPLIDHGQLSPAATYTDASLWGSTLGGAVVVARSGVGVTADGGLVYVAGPALTARSLAESLRRAGAVRAMTLDMNPEWVTFNFYNHDTAGAPGLLTPTKLYPQMVRPATRFLGPTRESRDFFTVELP